MNWKIIKIKVLKQKKLFITINKFAKDMNNVVKIILNNSTKAIESTKDNENMNTEDNKCYKTLLELKAILLKVSKKITDKRIHGFKKPDIKAHPAIKIGYSEDEPTTTDEHGPHRAQKKKVRIEVDH